MKKILLFLTIFCSISYCQLLPEKIKFVINDVYKHYENIHFEFVPIANVPIEFFEIGHLPFLDKGNIIQIKEEGIVWCSSNVRDSCVINDSCYVVIKTKLYYNIDWWKRSSAQKWFVLRTQRIFK